MVSTLLYEFESRPDYHIILFILRNWRLGAFFLSYRSMEYCYVYALMEKDKIYYIGQAKDPKKRFIGHMNGQSNDIVKKWISKLVEVGKQPTMSILDHCDCSRVNEREKQLIQEHASPALKNIQNNKWKDPVFIEQHWKEIHKRDLQTIDRQARFINEQMDTTGVGSLLAKIEKLEKELADYKERYQIKKQQNEHLIKQMKQYYK